MGEGKRGDKVAVLIIDSNRNWGAVGIKTVLTVKKVEDG